MIIKLKIERIPKVFLISRLLLLPYREIPKIGKTILQFCNYYYFEIKITTTHPKKSDRTNFQNNLKYIKSFLNREEFKQLANADLDKLYDY